MNSKPSLKVKMEKKKVTGKSLSPLSTYSLFVTLTKVANDKAVPFELKVPNAETRAAMEESEKLLKSGKVRFKTAEELFDALDGQTAKRKARRTSAAK